MRPRTFRSARMSRGEPLPVARGAFFPRGIAYPVLLSDIRASSVPVVAASVVRVPFVFRAAGRVAFRPRFLVGAMLELPRRWS